MFWIGLVAGLFLASFLIGVWLAYRDYRNCPTLDESGEWLG